MYGIQRRFCKNVLRTPRNMANGIAERELRGESRRGKMLRHVVKYLCRIMQMLQDEPVRNCYE